MSSTTAFMAAVLVINFPLPVLAHDIYSHLRDERGGSRCDDQDCRPALYRVTSSGVQMFVDRRWIDVPSEKNQYRALPKDTGETGGRQYCGSAYDPDFSTTIDLYITKCAVLPPQSASTQVDRP